MVKTPQGTVEFLFARVQATYWTLLGILMVLLGFINLFLGNRALGVSRLVISLILFGGAIFLRRTRPSRMASDLTWFLIACLVSLSSLLANMAVKNPLLLISAGVLLAALGTFLRSHRLYFALLALQWAFIAIMWRQAPPPPNLKLSVMSALLVATMAGGLVHQLLTTMVVRLQRSMERVLQARSEISRLKDFIPICAHCRKVRNDDGYWEQVELYISSHTCSSFSHGICPDCAAAWLAEGKPGEAKGA